ncbi:MAG: hypothetical protein OEZ06_16525 [Myxococcales bacterium]|nr:hypothetical protein [Myxococcales bacterium]
MNPSEARRRRAALCLKAALLLGLTWPPTAPLAAQTDDAAAAEPAPPAQAPPAAEPGEPSAPARVPAPEDPPPGPSSEPDPPSLPLVSERPQDEPALPAGLAPVDEEPALPAGLAPAEASQDEPALPAGLAPADTAPPLPPGLPTTADEPAAPGEQTPNTAAGSSDGPADEPWFDSEVALDVRTGGRVLDDRRQRQLSLAEARLQLDFERSFATMNGSARLAVDVIADALTDDASPRLETGRGFVDLREASLLLSPLSFADLKLGRQILTWGTGDLLFINDLFPKDWTALLVGRDREYLKAPSDAVKLAIFSSWLNIDLIYTPRFDADRHPDRKRLSSYDPLLGRRAGRDDPLHIERPDGVFIDDEVALRLYRNLGSYELALYGYRGRWKSPAGFDAESGRVTHPPLMSTGASLRGPLATGIANLEAGYYDSPDDRDGDDPLVENGQLRALAGYELQPLKDLMLGLQYYLEAMVEHGAYAKNQPDGPLRDALRHLLSLRLSASLLAQRLEATAIAFYSPSDRDGFLRLLSSYALNDHISLGAGANIFFGAKVHTFFGQLADNSSLYVFLSLSP